MTQPFRRGKLTWLAYLFLAIYGYFLNILGPITPFLKDELDLTYTVSSLHYTAFAVGILLIGLVGNLLIARIGRWPALWTGAAGLSLGAIFLLLGRSPVITIGAAFVMGFVGSLILVIVPSELADQHGDQRAVSISEANVMTSFVSAAAPLLVGWTAALPGGWRVALGIAAAAPILMRLGFGKGGETLKPAPEAAPIEAAVPHKPLPALYWVYWAALVLGVAVEFCMVSWSADYLENGLDIAKVYAAQSVSLFLIALIFGRLAASRLVRRFAARRVVLASLLVAGVGFVLFWTASTALAGLVGLFITGLGTASLYPLILSLAIGTAGSDTVQASTRATLASGTAILALPLILGRLADQVGIRLAYGVVGVLLVSAFVIILAAGRRVSASQPAQS